MRYAAVFAAGAILTAIVAFAMVRRAVGPIRVSWAIAPLWDLAKRAAPLGFSLVMLQIYWSMDQVLLGLLTNKTEVGQYAAAAKLPAVLSGFIAIWMSAVYPHASKLFTHDPDALRRQLGSFTSLSIVAALPLAAGSAIVGTGVMTGLFGQAYRPAGTPFAILMVASAIVVVSINYTSLAMAVRPGAHLCDLCHRRFDHQCPVEPATDPVVWNHRSSDRHGCGGVGGAPVCARQVVAVIGRPPLAGRRIVGAVAATAMMSAVLLAMPSSISVWLRIPAGAAVFLAVAAACGAVRRQDLALLQQGITASVSRSSAPVRIRSCKFRKRVRMKGATSSAGADADEAPVKMGGRRAGGRLRRLAIGSVLLALLADCSAGGRRRMLRRAPRRTRTG